jgi:hypothetical protein
MGGAADARRRQCPYYDETLSTAAVSRHVAELTLVTAVNDAFGDDARGHVLL